MATLKEAIIQAQQGKLPKDKAAKLKEMILAGKMDAIAQKEGIDIEPLKNAGGKKTVQTPGFLKNAAEVASTAQAPIGATPEQQAQVEMTQDKGDNVQVGMTTDIESAKPEKVGVMDVLTGDTAGKQSLLGGVIPEESAFTKNVEAITPTGQAKGILKGVGSAISGMASVGEKTINTVLPEKFESDAGGFFAKDGQPTAGDLAKDSDLLKADSATEQVIKTLTEVIAPLLATGGLTSGLAQLGTSGGTKALTSLGASQKTAQALSPVAGGLAQSPVQTALVTSSVRGDLPTKTELGIGMVLDSVIPGYSAIKQLKAKTFTEAVEQGVTKGVRPSVSGQKNVGDYTKYLEKAEDAVKTIAANRSALQLTDDVGEVLPAGSLPQNLRQFGEAIDQTKSTVFKAYDDLVKKTGDTGLVINTSNISEELSKIADDKAVQTFSEDTANYAKELMNKYGGEGVNLTPQQTQDGIKILNEQLQTFYRNPTPQGLSKAKVDAMVANMLRKNLDDSVSEITGGGAYQELKNAYGSLRAIEKDVGHRALIDARKSNKGLIDFTDIFSAGDVIAGISTGSLAPIVKGAAQYGIKSWFKALNDPNNIIKNMFSEADKLLPPMEISGRGVTEIVQEVSSKLPETMTKDQIAQLLVQVVKSLTLGER